MREAQDELRAGYVLGAPGVLVSGLVWLAAGVAWELKGGRTGFLLLFVGGMAIFPLSMLIARGLFRARPVASDNPLNRLAIETTVTLFAGLFVAFLILSLSVTLAFACFAAIVGARYFTFATLYRERLYWGLGGVMFALGVGMAMNPGLLPGNVALLVGIVELAFAALLLARWRVAA